MAIYIANTELGSPDDLSPAVLRYILEEHNRRLPRLQSLKDYHTNTCKVTIPDTDGSTPVKVGYGRYITEVILGYYLGDPVRYDAKPDDDGLTPGAIPAAVRHGRVVRIDQAAAAPDIKPVLEAYDRQTISDTDAEIGRDLGIYGKAYELLYASGDEVPGPRSAVIDPRCCEMIRDTTVDHSKRCFIMIEELTHVGGAKYWKMTVYTDTLVHSYIADVDMGFTRDGDPVPHFYGEVPAVEYSNNSDGMGDFEAEISLIDAYNTLTSDRVTDKSKFIDSVLAVFGASIDDDEKADLRKYKMLDGLPTDAKLEYIQKTLDEASVHTLAADIAAEIHKQSMTVDMTDSSFAGNASGQALKLKLLTMNILVKTKIRSMTRGLRKRFEMYNRWLNVKGAMPIIDRDQVEPIFSVLMPLDETAIVSMVSSLYAAGIIDLKTALGQLWFVKDPESVIQAVQAEAEAKASRYIDAYGMLRARENTEPETGDGDDL